MELRVGSRLRSAVCEAEVIVVRAPAAPLELWCGGRPMIPIGDEPPVGASLDPAHDRGTSMGKRYAHEELGLEVLCTKAGKGSLSLAGDPLPVKEAKPLPSSD